MNTDAHSLQMWDLLQGKNLFQTRGPDGKDSTPQHVAQMIALLGPPPPDLLQSSPRTGEFYEENGKRVARSAPVCGYSILIAIRELEGSCRDTVYQFGGVDNSSRRGREGPFHLLCEEDATLGL